MKNVAYKQPRSRDSVLIASRRICWICWSFY
jgi:hypothetical protein